MSSNIVRNSLYEGRRALHEQIGLEAELHVCEQLCKIFDKNRIYHGLPGYSGTDGQPDIFVRSPYGPLFIEVKSIRPFYRAYRKTKTKLRRTGYWKPGSAKLNKEAWANLKKLSMDQLTQIFIIVDLRFRKEDRRVDLLLTEDQIDRFVAKSTGKSWVHVSLSELMNNGLVLDYMSDPFKERIKDKDFKQQQLTR